MVAMETITDAVIELLRDDAARGRVIELKGSDPFRFGQAAAATASRARPRCRRLITVPIGIRSLAAASR